ncbi:MAG: DUF927 domain-containing protein [Caloramator sp.]|nr:DUF927 domain-containing protein [Caloramator sp.]
MHKLISMKKNDKAIYPEIVTNNHEVFKFDSEKREFIKIANYIGIEKIYKNIDDNSILFKLVYKYRNNFHEMLVKRDIFTKPNLIKLSEYGVDVNDSNVFMIQKHLRNCEEIAEIELIHKDIGWHEYENNRVFKANQIISPYDLKSSYVGELDIIPNGELNKWLNMIRDEVLGNVALETILAIGFSSALVNILKEKIDNENIVCHIYGDSSCGKTTSAMLAVSIWGNPDIKSKGLLLSWHSTANALIKLCEGNKGMVIAIDESSAASLKEFSDIIYTLATGKNKQRLNADSELRKINSWSTTIISTGENSLLENSNKNTGLRTRLIEISINCWTSSAENAERIKEIVLKNYGVAGIYFVEKLINVSEETLVQRFEVILDNVKNKIYTKIENKKFNIYERISKKIAVIILAAEFMKEFFDLEINIDKINEFLIENISIFNIENSVELEEKALDDLLNYITTNNHMFEKNIATGIGNQYEDIHVFGKCLGKIWENDNYTEIAIIQTEFKNVLKELGYTEPQVILKKLKSKGILRHDKGMLTTKRKIRENSVRVYCFILEKNTIENRKKKQKIFNKTENILPSQLDYTRELELPDDYDVDF